MPAKNLIVSGNTSLAGNLGVVGVTTIDDSNVGTLCRNNQELTSNSVYMAMPTLPVLSQSQTQT